MLYRTDAPFSHNLQLLTPCADRCVFHDQPLPGGNRHAVFRDETARNGADGGRALASAEPVALVKYGGK